MLRLALILLAAAADPAAEYAERAAKLEGRKDAKAWLALADFCEDRGLLPQREEALRRILGFSPDQAEARRRLDETRTDEGWIPDDEAEAAEAAANEAKGLVFYGARWVPAKEAERLREADRLSMGWDLELRIDTPRLAVYSSQSLDFTRRLADVLENGIELHRRLNEGVWKLQGKPVRLQVFVYKSRNEFLRKGKRLADARRKPGPHEDLHFWDQGDTFYDGESQTLYVGSSVDTQDPTRILVLSANMVVRSWDHLACGIKPTQLPPWLLQGRGFHFANGIVGRQVIPASCRMPRDLSMTALDGLAEVSAQTLRGLVTMKPETFDGEGQQRHYALAWSLVHFLLHGERGRHADAFRGFLRGCPHRSGPADFEKALGRMEDLEPAWRAYVQDVLVPALRAN